ncbi:hypothetical protein R9X47_01690 [Wukongibacter baidiensis]
MAIVVQHKVTLQKFIFLGVGYDMYKRFIGGNLIMSSMEVSEWKK